jgi:hypothetical protein
MRIIIKIFLFAVAFLISSLILLSCKKDNPVPPDQQPQVNLTLEDVSCTEACFILLLLFPIVLKISKRYNLV